MIFWQKQLLYAQSPNANLALILQSPKEYFGKNNYFMLKAQILIWHLFTKAQVLLASIFIKPKCYFGTYLLNSNIILTLALHILSL